MKKRTEAEILKDIESGAYRDCYLIYNRKSTDDTDNQKNSIKYQKSENTRFAFRNGLPIAALTIEGFCTDGIVSERHSGFKENIELTFGIGNTVQYRVERPKFHQLVQLLSKGYFKGVIFLCWDRASRNKGDDTIIRKLMKAGIDIRFTLAQYDKTSAGELHMDIDGMFAEHHSRVTREKVTITMRNARARGLCTHKAPVGYLNQGSMEHKPLDLERAPIIKQLFELAATGDWSLADLARWAVEQGFTMPPIRRRRTQGEILAEEEDDMRLEVEKVSHLPTFNSIHKILTNPTYTGKVPNEDGIYTPTASLEAIVSDELYREVQGQLRKKKQSAHYIEHLDHPLRGLMFCGVCARVYTPYVKKGITYYGARCAKDCPNPRKSVNFAFIAGKVGELIARLVFTKDELAEINARTTTDLALLDMKRIDKIEAGERRKKKIREDLKYLRENRLPLLRGGAYTPEGIAEEEARLNQELLSLSSEEMVSDVSMAETVKEVVKLSELIEYSIPVYDFANPTEKERIIRTIFSELTLSEDTLQYQCKNGFKALQGRFVASSEPIVPKLENDRKPRPKVAGGYALYRPCVF
ncbi:MAG: recombinase family protein [Patescibacteria group bacterium]|nr:recombinase family protein [Patescibacteria group bacterium]MDE2058039.1 recombinase family protein [Patescibacteria group bacterium]